MICLVKRNRLSGVVDEFAHIRVYSLLKLIFAYSIQNLICGMCVRWPLKHIINRIVSYFHASLHSSSLDGYGSKKMILAI